MQRNEIIQHYLEVSKGLPRAQDPAECPTRHWFEARVERQDTTAVFQEFRDVTSIPQDQYTWMAIQMQDILAPEHLGPVLERCAREPYSAYVAYLFVRDENMTEEQAAALVDAAVGHTGTSAGDVAGIKYSRVEHPPF